MPRRTVYIKNFSGPSRTTSSNTPGLFGYETSFKALKAVERQLLEPAERKPPPGTTTAFTYHNFEGGAAAYYRLTDNQAALDSLGKLITPGRISDEPLQWDAYTVKGTAEEWHALMQNGPHYGKNGFKIAAAPVYENIVGLSAFQKEPTNIENNSVLQAGERSR